MLADEIKAIKSRKKMSPMEQRLQEYIDFANATKRFSDAGFYEEVLDYIETLKKKLK
jgi:hypothetical protein